MCFNRSLVRVEHSNIFQNKDQGIIIIMNVDHGYRVNNILKKIKIL